MAPENDGNGIPQTSADKEPTLLVIDDEKTITGLLRRAFEKQGFRVFVSNSAANVAELLRRGDFDVVLSDIRMPEITGIELLQEVKRHDPELPVLLMTGFADVESASRAVELGAEAYLTKPLDLDHTIRSVKQAAAKRRLILDKREEEKRIFEKLAEMSGRVRSNLMNVIKMLREILRKKDPYLVEHSIRVSRLATTLARKMGLDAASTAEIKAAALLMDIGMIAVSDRLLDSKMPLGKRKKTQIREHVGYGKQLLSVVITNERILRLIECHHEHWDGSGVLRLSGEQIPLGARILRVADAYATMISERPYHRALSPEKAAKLLKEGAGSRFDPRVVEAFLAKEEPVEAAAELGSAQGEAGDLICRLSEGPNSGQDTHQQAAADSTGEEGHAVDDRRPPEPHVSPSCTTRELRKRLHEAGELGATSFVAEKVISLCRSPHVEVSDVAKYAAQDAAIASRILRVANSSLYNRGRPVTELVRAISGIGLRTIGGMVTGMVVTNRFGRNPDSLSVRPEWFWEHSIACGALTLTLCERSKIPGDEDPFLAGLFHDVGRAVLDQVFPDEYHPLLRLATEKGYAVEKLEKAALSMTHADVAELLLRRWDLGRFIPLTVNHHNSLATLQGKSRGYFEKAASLALANAAVKAAAIGFGGSTILEPLHEFALHFKLDYEELLDLLEKTQNDTNTLKASFMTGSAASFEQDYKDFLLEPLGDGASGLFVGSRTHKPDEVELFLDSAGLIARDADALGDKGPEFVVCRPEKKETLADCMDRVQGLEKSLGLDPLPVIVLADAKFQAPQRLPERRVILIGIPVSTSILLDAIRSVRRNDDER